MYTTLGGDDTSKENSTKPKPCKGAPFIDEIGELCPEDDSGGVCPADCTLTKVRYFAVQFAVRVKYLVCPIPPARFN